MPTYVYRCPVCGHTTEVVKPLSELDDVVWCPQERCLGSRMERQATAPGFVVNGYAYRNGYSQPGPRK